MTFSGEDDIDLPLTGYSLFYRCLYDPRNRPHPFINIFIFFLGRGKAPQVFFQQWYYRFRIKASDESKMHSIAVAEGIFVNFNRPLQIDARKIRGGRDSVGPWVAPVFDLFQCVGIISHRIYFQILDETFLPVDEGIERRLIDAGLSKI